MAPTGNLAVTFSGGLGDMLVATPFLFALHELIDHKKFDIFVSQPPALVRDLYHDMPFVKRIFPTTLWDDAMDTYDGTIRVDEMVLYRLKEHALPAWPQLAPVAARGAERASVFGPAIKFQPYFNNQLARHAVFLNLDRRSLPIFSSGLQNDDTVPTLHLNPAQFDVLDTHDLRDEAYITIHDGWDGNFPVTEGKRPTKVWLPMYWEMLVENIKTDYPHLKIVQLGSLKTGMTIEGAHVDLRGKTSIAEALVILKHSRLHIDTESGLVHFARAMHTPTVCMIGPTNAKFFGYARNRNLQFDGCNNCWWITQDWMENCLRGLELPECMARLTPNIVMDVVTAELNIQPSAHYTAQPAQTLSISADHAVGVFADAERAHGIAQINPNVWLFADSYKNFHVPVHLPYRQRAGQIFNLPCENNSFDYFYANVSSIATAHLPLAVTEILRILKSGGTALLTVDAAQTAAWQGTCQRLNIANTADHGNISLLKQSFCIAGANPPLPHVHP